MNATTSKTTGFYATDCETFYLTPSGRTWIVSSPDFEGILEIGRIPDKATKADGLLTPDECLGYCRQVEEESGERLIETASE